MENLYGFKENDIELLAQYVKNKNNRTLSSVFEEFALKTGKAKGTVRNMYYALAKKTNEDENFCKKYFDEPLKVGKAQSFNQDEEKNLAQIVLKAKSQGRSARSTISELAKGDMKLALRYQNKFRNIVKNNPQLVSEVMNDIHTNELPEKNKFQISEVQYVKLKKEIDGLVGRISEKIRKENLYLKERIAILETENTRLINLLRIRGDNKNVIKFFRESKGKDMLN